MRGRGTRRPRGEAGFTFLEVLITVAILAWVLAMIMGVLLAVLQNQRRVEELSRRDEAGTNLLAVMTRDIRSIWAYDQEDPFWARDEGDRDRVGFVVRSRPLHPDEDGAGGGPDSPFPEDEEEEDEERPVLLEVGYVLQEDRSSDRLDAYTLFRREQREPDGDLEEGGSHAALYGPVEALDLEFLTEEDEWVREWGDQAPAPIPKAVRITLRLSPEEEPETGRESEVEEGRRTYRTVVALPVEPYEPEEDEEEEGGGR